MGQAQGPWGAGTNPTTHCQGGAAGSPGERMSSVLCDPVMHPGRSAMKSQSQSAYTAVPPQTQSPHGPWVTEEVTKGQKHKGQTSWRPRGQARVGSEYATLTGQTLSGAGRHHAAREGSQRSLRRPGRTARLESVPSAHQPNLEETRPCPTPAARAAPPRAPH